MIPTKAPCPECSERGRFVHPATLSGVLRAEELQRLSDLEGFQFCATPGCGLAYYDSSGRTVDVGGLRVRIGAKETTGPRPLCYCFDFTAADIEADVEAHGDSPIPDEITEKCRAGLDRCEETNPRGACCLGDIRRCLRAAMSEFGDRSSPAPGASLPSCCSSSAADVDVSPDRP